MKRQMTQKQKVKLLEQTIEQIKKCEKHICTGIATSENVAAASTFAASRAFLTLALINTSRGDGKKIL